MMIKRMPVGTYSANCYVLMDEDTKECAVIDPGENWEAIDKTIKDLGAEKVKFIFLTHGHADHTEASEYIKKIYHSPICINHEDYNMMKRATFMYGDIYESVDKFIEDGDVFEVGKLKIKAIYTPGHTPGGMSFIVDNVVFTGDTLFYGSIGRTDMAGGNYEIIIDSIRNKLMVLPDDLIVLPGHGDKTSIGRERQFNPFL